MADDTTRISVRPVRTKKLPILTGQQSLPRLRSIGDVAKRLRRWIANPLFVGSNPTVASFGGNSARLLIADRIFLSPNRQADHINSLRL